MVERRFRSPRWAFLAATLSLAPGLAAAQPRWPEERWNPTPMPDDLVLPLPCNGAIAFRPITTPMPAGALSDRPVTLGQADPETDYSEYLRRDFVVGPFRPASGPPTGPPVYYLAKYEVTRDQYAAVTAEACPELPSPTGRLPQAEVSWLEAMGFTARLSGWLVRNARAALPSVDDAPGFIRLPTEAEWEYAARGGAVVPEAEFGARVFPMPNGLRAHVWHQGSRSAGGRARPVGTLQPNPLGLFDILGNLSEWVLEPYRLNKVGRGHGWVGGQMVRGGDFQTSEGQVRSSLRLELPLLRAGTGEPLRLATVGFRPAIGVVVTTSDARPPQFVAAFEAEAQSRGNAAEDPARQLEALRTQLDEAARRRIEQVQATLRGANRERLDAARARLRSDLRAAASLARQIYLANGNGALFGIAATLPGEVEQAMTRGRTGPPSGEDQAVLATLRRIETALRGRATEAPAAARQAVGNYLGQLAQVPRETTAAEIAEQVPVVLQELRAQGQPGMPELAELAARHLTATLAGQAPAADQAEQDIMAAYRPAPPAAAPAAPAPPAQRPRR